MRVDNIDLYLSYVFLKTVKFRILIPFYVQETIYCKAILPNVTFQPRDEPPFLYGTKRYTA